MFKVKAVKQLTFSLRKNRLLVFINSVYQIEMKKMTVYDQRIYSEQGAGEKSKGWERTFSVSNASVSTASRTCSSIKRSHPGKNKQTNKQLHAFFDLCV